MKNSNLFSSWKVLVDFRRNNLIENTFHGSVSWFHGDQQIHSFGETTCYGRSTMKPFYMKVFYNELESILSTQQKAIALGSHNGWSEQVLVAQSILKSSEMELLQTPFDLPLIQEVGHEVAEASRWCNNSSGHHAAILRGCGLKYWSQKNYTSLEHPLFKAYLNILSDALGLPVDELVQRTVAREGDGLPTLEMNIGEIARCYSSLAKDFHKSWIWEAMVTEPFLVGGVGRLDTVIIQSCEGKVLAKEGADGLLALAIQHKDYPDGLGIAIKLAHGWSPSVSWFLAHVILGSLGFSLARATTAGSAASKGCSWAPKFGCLKRQKAVVSQGVIPNNFECGTFDFDGEGEQGF